MPNTWVQGFHKVTGHFILTPGHKITKMESYNAITFEEYKIQNHAVEQ